MEPNCDPGGAATTKTLEERVLLHAGDGCRPVEPHRAPQRLSPGEPNHAAGESAAAHMGPLERVHFIVVGKLTGAEVHLQGPPEIDRAPERGDRSSFDLDGGWQGQALGEGQSRHQGRRRGPKGAIGGAIEFHGREGLGLEVSRELIAVVRRSQADDRADLRPPAAREQQEPRDERGERLMT